MKKTWMLFLLAVSAVVSHADEPRNFCYRGCSQRQSEIWQAFEASQLDLPKDISPQVYSGECYHLTSNMDNTIAHYGVGYFAPAPTSDSQSDPRLGQAIYFSGVFAFFYANDPYVNYTPENALSYFPKHGRPQSLIVKQELSGSVDFSNDETIWKYWFRPSPDLKKLYVVAMWSYKHTVFCEWTRHDSK